jgi:hypothetical protein
MLQEDRRHFSILMPRLPGGLPQGGLTPPVSRVNVGPFAEKIFHDPDVLLFGRDVQGREPRLPLLRVNRSASLDQQFDGL